MTREYIKALEHWVKQFRNGNLSDKFADEIAYLLEDKAHDLKMDMDTDEINTLQKLIEEKDQQIRELNKKYQGVRPSWVSDEIGGLCMSANYYREQIKSLKGVQ